MAYDDDNVFAKIIRGEIPCDKVYENDHALAFHDINPQAPVHVLVIPKGRYESIHDFSTGATPEEAAALHQAIGAVADALGVAENGYRVLTNSGRDAHQEVPHFHFHIFAGKKLGIMLPGGHEAPSTRG